MAPEDQICASCQAIFSNRDTFHRITHPDGISHKADRAHFLQPAATRCLFCKLLKLTLPQGWRRLREATDGEQAHVSWTFRIVYDIKANLLRIVRVDQDGQDIPYSYVVERRIVARQGDDILNVLGDPAPQYDLNDLRTYRKIQNWLKECDSSHAQCSVKRYSNPPSRLLDLTGHGNMIKLITEETQGKQYTALSYCWGAPQSESLTSARLEAYKAGIPVKTLPLTVQHAIIVTRRLAISYLWCDAYCILQDSHHNKTVEVPKMGSIYENAYLTINAATANTCNDGFLLSDECDFEFFLPFCGPGGEVSNVALKFPCEQSALFYSDGLCQQGCFTEEGVNSRSWTFQERFLSKRMLVTQRQLFWMCNETWGKDGGIVTRDHYFTTLYGRGLAPLFSADLFDSVLGDSFEFWSQIIATYTEMRLSVSSDRLPALSSIAAIYASKINDQYIAGLWERTIVRWLCWHTSSEVFAVSRPSKWRAPSWSFFSLDTGTYFREEILDGNGLRQTSWHVSSNVKPLSHEAPFGEILAASLEIRGRLIPVLLRPEEGFVDKEDIRWAIHEQVKLKDDLTSEYGLGTATLDVPPEPATVVNRQSTQASWTVESLYGPVTETDNELVCLPLWCFNSKDNYLQWWNLLLARRSDGCYHRLGCVFDQLNTQSSKWLRLFNQASISSITIV